MNESAKTTVNYESFSKSTTSKQWEKIGVKKRAGVAVPLFSLFSEKSVGIGELTDLKLLVDWCRKCGLSIIQLLPMNDVGFTFTPYDAQSTFALEPMYLSLENLEGVSAEDYKKELAALRKQFPPGGGFVRYGIKGAKLALLWDMFRHADLGEHSQEYQSFCDDNQFWLNDYALFRVIKESSKESGWQDWAEPLKSRDPDALAKVQKKNEKKIEFQKWLQWQLFEQFKEVKAYASAYKIFVMGDLPLLVSRDSADTWANQQYFKLELASGAPPDAYFTLGQRWGMPPYNWGNIAANQYDYIVEKLRYAGNFYDFFRIDHAVGLFRLWTISMAEPEENAGLNGVFDPQNEEEWEEHGRQLLSVMVNNTHMLPCAEDLGTVPECSYKVLDEFGIPGMDVQRWIRDWDGTKDFKAPEDYRKNAIAVVSTHDMSSFCGWWDHESATIDEMLFQRHCRDYGLDEGDLRAKLFNAEKSANGRLRWNDDVQSVDDLLQVIGRDEGEVHGIVQEFRSSFDEQKRFVQFLGSEADAVKGKRPKFVAEVLRKSNESSCIFSVQQIIDWLSMSPAFLVDSWSFRINWPGTVGDQNWTLVMPWSLEEINRLPVNKKIMDLNQSTGRA